MALDVACLGILVADMVAKPVLEIPPPGQLRLVDEMGLHLGGCAGNTAVGLRRLGVRSGVLGKVGADALGAFIRNALEAEGVDIAGVIVDAQTATSGTVALVGPEGERGFLHTFGGNGALRAADVRLEGTGPAPLLHIGGAGLMPAFDGAPLAEVCRRAQALGMKVSLDTAWDPLGRWHNVRPVLPYLDYFLPSLEEAQRIMGVDTAEEIADLALEQGPSVVVVKMGGQGCYVRSRGEPGRFLSALAVEAVDTTGAGDAFCAGFLAGVSHAWPVERCALLGNAVAALSVRVPGAVEGVRPWAETIAVMEAGAI